MLARQTHFYESASEIAQGHLNSSEVNQSDRNESETLNSTGKIRKIRLPWFKDTPVISVIELNHLQLKKVKLLMIFIRQMFQNLLIIYEEEK